MNDLFDWNPPTKYPESPGYVRWSQTSKAAADSVKSSAESMRAAVWSFIWDCAAHGATCDEVETALDMCHQTASARVTELHKFGDLKKTERVRKTRRGRNAAVYTAIRRRVSDGS